MSEKPKFVYVTYIAATPEKVWQALTDPEMTEKYWFGFRIAANGNAGDHMTATDPGGKVVHRDPIIESNPLYDDFKHERPSRVTFEIEPIRDHVRLTVVHDDFDPGSVVFEKIQQGWPAVLSSLKSYAETGRSLSEPPWRAAAAAE